MPTELKCPRCGTAFTCSVHDAAVRCWCAELPHVLQPGETTTCWCPACLQAEIDARQKQSPQPLRNDSA